MNVEPIADTKNMGSDNIPVFETGFDDSPGAPSNPRKLLFITPGVTPQQQDGRQNEVKSMLRDISPHATVLYTHGEWAEADILHAISQQVRKYGTLKEIVIDSHGNPNHLYATHQAKPAPNTFFGTDNLLNKLQNMQTALGTKIADRIVFMGCDVMTDLAPNWVDYYRNKAKSLGTEIVGNSSIGWGGDFHEAAVVRFGADGSVSRDQLNTDPLLLQWTSVQQDFSNVLHGQFSRIENDNHSDAWFGCQNRRTEAKGDACQFHMVDTDIRRMEVQEQIVNTGTEIFFAPNDIPDHLSLSYLGPKGWRNVIHKIENVQKAHPGGAFIALPSTMMELRDDYYSALSGNPEYEQSALVAHENFVRSLSPEGKKFVTGFAESYKKASSAPPSQPNLALSPSARKDSRPSARTAIPPLPIKKEGAEAAKPKPLTSPANKVRTAGFSAGT